MSSNSTTERHNLEGFTSDQTLLGTSRVQSPSSTSASYASPTLLYDSHPQRPSTARSASSPIVADVEHAKGDNGSPPSKVDSIADEKISERSTGTKIDGWIRMWIPWVGMYTLKLPGGALFFTWATLLLTCASFLVLGLFAWNSTRSYNTNVFVLSSTQSIFILTSISSAAATFLGMLVDSGLEAVRWHMALRGVHFTTFLGMAPATGYGGKVSLVTARRVTWSTKAWVLVIFMFAGINYVLSFLLTVGLTSATIYNDSFWDYSMLVGIGPFVPYDLGGILFSSPSLSDKIAVNFNGFTSDTTQMLPLTANLSNFPGSHDTVAPIRPLCPIGCYAYLMPGTADQVLQQYAGASPLDEPPITTLCNASHPDACIAEPYVFDPEGINTLNKCDPADRQCIMNAVLADRSSPFRSNFSTKFTNMSSWSGYSTADSLRTDGPVYMVYFEPLAFDGPARANNMTECRVFNDMNGYALNACYQAQGPDVFGVGWSVCEPVTHGCNASDQGWRQTLSSSTVISFEMRNAGVVHQLPGLSQITAVEKLDAAQPVTINSTQFYNVFTSAFTNTAALRSLVYNTAIHPDLSLFGADIRMRDLLSYTLMAASSSVSVEVPADYTGSFSWNNLGQGGIAVSTDRISINNTSLYVYIGLAAFTLVFCGVMLIYAGSGLAPNSSDFPELDIATRAVDRSFLDGLSNAGNDEVTERICDTRVYLGESADGRSVEIAAAARGPLKMDKPYY